MPLITDPAKLGEKNALCADEEFLEAVKAKDVDAVRALNFSQRQLELKADKNRTLLHLATFGFEEKSSSELVKFLIDHKACPIDERDYKGRTALHNAAMSRDLEVMKELLEHGANPNAKCDNKCSVIGYALSDPHMGGNVEAAVKLLIEKGADCTISDAYTHVTNDVLREKMLVWHHTRIERQLQEKIEDQAKKNTELAVKVARLESQLSEVLKRLDLDKDSSRDASAERKSPSGKPGMFSA